MDNTNCKNLQFHGLYIHETSPNIAVSLHYRLVLGRIDYDVINTMNTDDV